MGNRVQLLKSYDNFKRNCEAVHLVVIAHETNETKTKKKIITVIKGGSTKKQRGDENR